MKAHSKIILASQSPRRKQLLQWAELVFEVIVSHTDESYPAHLTPQEIALFIAQNKATAVQNLIPNTDAIIIAADTIVVINNTILGKPINAEDAINMLTTLSGSIHQVITGVVIMQHNKIVSFADITQVEFNTLTKEQITFYIEKYKPFDKAGSYAIQEWIGVVGIKKITGDFYNVMGLPVSRVLQTLQQFN
jgi:septum formation protein